MSSSAKQISRVRGRCAATKLTEVRRVITLRRNMQQISIPVADMLATKKVVGD